MPAGEPPAPQYQTLASVVAPPPVGGVEGVTAGASKASAPSTPLHRALIPGPHLAAPPTQPGCHNAPMHLDLLDTAIAAAAAGAEVVTRYFRGSSLDVKRKGENDFVTRADKESEEAIVRTILS